MDPPPPPSSLPPHHLVSLSAAAAAPSVKTEKVEVDPSVFRTAAGSHAATIVDISGAAAELSHAGPQLLILPSASVSVSSAAHHPASSPAPLHNPVAVISSAQNVAAPVSASINAVSAVPDVSAAPPDAQSDQSLDVNKVHYVIADILNNLEVSRKH